jgi:ribosomal protein S18 acetylase RimI-like enzyme
MYALFAMWVNPEHRGKGLGRRLIDMGLEWVRARDGIRGSDGRPEGGVGSVLVLEVFEDNERARSFYRGTGFQEVENTCYTGAERGRVTLMLNL